MSDSDQRHGLLGVVGAAVALAACVPKVPATIVVEDPPAPKRRANQPKPSKPSTGPDHSPPKVARAELLSSTRLRVHFSEPVVVPANFDPADFRLSFLRRYSDRAAGTTYAYYYDAAYFHYGTPIIHARAQAGETSLDIEFNPAFSSALCHRDDYYGAGYQRPGVEMDQGLFLHYAAGSIPISDPSGNVLADFGAAWVDLGRLQPPQMREVITGNDAGRAGTTLVQLTCGPPIPPGPR